MLPAVREKLSTNEKASDVCKSILLRTVRKDAPTGATKLKSRCVQSFPKAPSVKRKLPKSVALLEMPMSIWPLKLVATAAKYWSL